MMHTLKNLKHQKIALNHSGWGGKRAKSHPPTSFSSVTSAYVGTGPKNLLTFIFNPFVTLG